ncbi:phage tail protein [Streptomyces sp. UG1]|uniref:phage tail protein n=1 Tax=Streptomyces sp. UG1 TaxID=3417652 RepID=UPI003CE98A4A
MPIVRGDFTPGAVLPEIGFATASFTGPDGVTWPLTNPPGGWFTLADGVSGVGAAPVELTTDDHPRGGSRLRHVQPVSRTVVWPLHVYGDDHLQFTARWRALARAFTGTLRRRPDGTYPPGVLEIARPDGTRRRIECFYREGFEGQGARGTGINSDTAILSLYCEDPYFYDPQPMAERREFATGEDFLQPYPSVSSGQVLGATVLVNPGDVIAWPSWTITGPASLVTFTHDDSGDSFVLDPADVSGSLLAHEQVIITTDPPKVTKYTTERQTIDLGGATAGTVTITFDGQTTGSIAYNADAATVQAALEALSNLDAEDVFVTGGPLPGTITLTFAGQYLGVNVPEVTVTPTGLTGGTVTVATVTEGATANWVGALNWPGAVLWPLEPGPNAVTFQLDGSGPGSAVEVQFFPRFETA